MAKILIVIPHDRFQDEEYIAVCKALKEAGHTVEIGSSHHTEAEGHFGLMVKPDIEISFVEPIDYDALVLIGGRGIEEYISDRILLSKIGDFSYQNKLIAALGMAVEILAYAGVISSKKVTCDNETIPKVQYTGGYYTGTLTEVDGNIITGSGLAAKEEFAQSICSALEYENRLREMRHARAAGS